MNYEIIDSEFYELESWDEQLRFLLQYAILAPSTHNTQPWSFRITPDGVQVLPDYSRRLPVVDPLDRELWMSIGAAIANLRVAAAHFGFETTVLYQRTPEVSDMVALVAFRETCAPDDERRRLFPAIKKRHTNRHPFDREPVEPEALKRLCDVIDRDSDTLRLILPRDKGRVADLVAFADREQLSQPDFRHELAERVHPEWLFRYVDMGLLQGARDRELIETAAALLVVAANDDRLSLVSAGETLERLLLAITLEGLDYSFLNSPIQVQSLRDRMWGVAGTTRPPQLLIRIGRARSAARAMPRRPVEEVLV